MLCRWVRRYSSGNFIEKGRGYLKAYDAPTYHYVHKECGTEVVQVHNARDTNHVFVIGFPTYPTCDSGVAHVLEHVTLCGSTKYPVRDPFFKMQHRSLATYMNAWTFPDMTLYPFATMNAQDMRGLREVYWDAVFHPLLRSADFRQEGWRLERDKDGRLTLQGVVLNEMKGVLADATSVFSYEMSRHMYKGTPYGYMSGGDPLAIPSLNLSDLSTFHKTHYTPSLARIFIYGPPESMEEHMTFLSERLAGMTAAFDFRRHSPLSLTFPVHNYCPPLGQRISVSGPVDNMLPIDRQARFAMVYALPMLSEKTLPLMRSLQVLSSLLLDGPSAPLYRALLEGGQLGDSYVTGVGLDATNRFPTFTIGLSGTSSSHFSAIEASVQNVLEVQRKTCFDADRVSGILHSLDVQQRHVTADLGLRLAQSIFLPWLHQINPLVALQEQDRTDQLRSQLLESSQFLNDLLDKFLLNSPYLVLTMQPDPKYLMARQADEENLIKSLITKEDTKTSEDLQCPEGMDREYTSNSGEDTLIEDESSEDVSVLPCLSPSVISTCPPGHVSWLHILKSTDAGNMPSNVDFIPSSLSTGSFSSLSRDDPNYFFEREDATNDLWYLRAIYKAAHDPWMPLLLACFGRQPTDMFSVTELDTAIQRTTADFGIAIHRNTSISDASSIQLGILVQVSALTANANAALHLFHQILGHMRLDTVCTQTVLTNITHEGISALPDHAIGYAKRLALVTLPAPPAILQQRRLEESMFGLSQLCFLRHIKDNLSIKDVMTTLQVKYSQLCDSLVLQRAALVKSLGVHMQIQDLPLDPHSITAKKVGGSESPKIEPLACEPNEEDSQQIVQVQSQVNSDRNSKFDTVLPVSAWGTFVDLKYAVSYTALVVDLAGLLGTTGRCGWLHLANPTLTLIATIISDKFLHAQIREKNGAYGSGLQYDAFHGLLHFYSYRDPMPLNSISIFKASLAWFLRASDRTLISHDDTVEIDNGKNLENGSKNMTCDSLIESVLDSLLSDCDLDGTIRGCLTEQDLIEAKLSVFKDLDRPRDVEDKGLPEFYHDITVEMLTARRTAVLNASLQDLHRTARLYLLPLLAAPKQELSGSVKALSSNVIESGSKMDLQEKLESYQSLENDRQDLWQNASRAVIIGGGIQETLGVALSNHPDWSILADLKL